MSDQANGSRRPGLGAHRRLVVITLLAGATVLPPPVAAEPDAPRAGTAVCAGLGPAPALETERTWDASGSPYSIDCLLRVRAPLAVEPGTELRFGKGAGLVFESRSGLEIRGVAPGDVQLISSAAAPAPGDWVGLVFEEADADLRGFTLSHATIGLQAPLAGSALNGSITIADAVIRESAADGLRVRDVELSVEDSELRGNAGFGLHMSGLTVARLVGNRFVGNGQTGYFDGSGYLGGLETEGNLAVGNGRDALWVAGLAAARLPQRWGGDLARELRGELRVPPNAELRIEPGARVELDRGSRIRVDGSFSADGATFASDLRSPTLEQSWEGIHIGPQADGRLLRSTLMGGGAGRGAILLSGSSEGPGDGPLPAVGFNRFLQLAGLGLRIEARAAAPVVGNLFHDLRGLQGQPAVAIQIGGGAGPGGQAALSISRNRFRGMDRAIELDGEAAHRLEANGYEAIRELAVQNRALARCLEAPASWWGDGLGPIDRSRDADDPCGRELFNAPSPAPWAARVGDGVDYRGWLVERPPGLPRLDGPACGVTNQTRLSVSGSVEPEGAPGVRILIGDGLEVRAEGATDAEGRFSLSVPLIEGEQLLAARSAPAGADPSALSGPQSEGRRIRSDPSLPVDPLGTRFVYGATGDRRAQALRDASGCAAGCAGAGGFAELPPGLPVRLEVPVAGSPRSVELLPEAGAPIPLSPGAGGIWATAAFTPTEGGFRIRVDPVEAGDAFDCPGYIHLAETGKVFLDTGAPGEALLEQGFESGDAPGWIASRGWQVSDEDAHEGNYSITDSPDGRYGPGLDLALSQAEPIDLSGLVAPELSFWHRHRLAAGDRAWVEARGDGTDRWRYLADFEGSTGGWRAERVSLAGFSGRGVQLRFRLVTDADPLSVDEGWSLDDIRIGPGGALDGRFQAGEPAQAGAEVTLLQLSPDTGHWRVWAGAGQVNPQTTDAAGRYGFYGLAPGIYRTRVSSPRLREQLLASQQVGDGVYAEPLALRAGGFRIYLPFATRPTRASALRRVGRDVVTPHKAWLPILVEQGKAEPGRRRVFEWSIFREQDGLASSSANALELAPDGSLWVIAGSRYRYDPSTRRYIREPVSALSQIRADDSVRVEPVPESLGAGELFDLLFGPDGEIWVAAETGLLRRDRAGRWQLFQPPAEWGLGLDGPTAIARDREGGILYPTCGGIAVLSPAGRWRLVEGPVAMHFCACKKLTPDAEGRHWLSFDFEFDHLLGLLAPDDWRSLVPEIDPGAKDFTDIAFAPDGGLWISSWGGVYHRAARGDWQVFDALNSPLYGIRDLALDAAGNAWFGSSEMGTLHARWGDGSWTSWGGDRDGPPEPELGPPASWGEALLPTRLTTGRPGELWMVDAGYGSVARLRYREEILQSVWP